MRAAVLREFGGPEALTVRDVDTPRPGPGEVLVRVRASSANPVDGIIRRGLANPNLALPAVIGSDVAGEVEQVGDGVTDVAVGDAVYYTSELASGGGAYAQYHVAAASIVAPKPTSLSFAEAAAIPLAGGTAWEAIVRRLGVRPGQTVLVHGGSGGVGTFAVQFARAAGASVLATAGADHQQLLRDLGATPIDYKSEDFVEVARTHTDGTGVDAVLDTVGGENVGRSCAATRDGGRIATILGPEGRLDDLYQRNQTLYGIFLSRERRRLTEMTPLFERGLVHPRIAKTMPLDDIVAIHERLDEGHNAGKLVIDVP
ncbi:zinc-binding dehydrogenase [Nocardia elegans]|uniref:Zinc-binding dehydrogenase n=1 Tax=Nocardia elegans TaxID=300029 RepID=A0ABW6TG26_9NOCA|nr:zinc-binding dehydrogenase [Nocardia elegans]MBF6449956.1 zinc-binding dehydrogenase [Nocardia elegans]